MIKNIDTDATICYWSGTGNSYRVATWIQQAAQNRGLETSILSFDETLSKKAFLKGRKNIVADHA